MLEKIVAFCLRWPWATGLLTLALLGPAVISPLRNLRLIRIPSNLFSSSLPWRQNENKLYKTFPETVDLIVAVIDAETPEKADTAAKELTKALSGQPLMSRVWQPDDNPFFRKNGLLYLSQAEVEHHIGMLIGKADATSTAVRKIHHYAAYPRVSDRQPETLCAKRAGNGHVSCRIKLNLSRL